MSILYKNAYKKMGFSLFEILAVIAILGIIVSIAWGSVTSLVEKTAVEGARDMFVSTLARSQKNATARKNDSSWGVLISPTGVLLFSGSSYATRTATEDMFSSFSQSVSVGGATEYVFQKESGYLASALSTSLMRQKTASISISKKGIITY